MKIKECAKKDVEQVIAMLARKSASVEANTACSCWGYQPKEPKQVKALRRFWLHRGRLSPIQPKY